MKKDVIIPEVGESVSQGLLTAWLKKDGAYVSEGEDLFELETDKATLAIPSPASGILSVIVAEGSEVNIGQVVAGLDTDKVLEEKLAPEAKKEVESLISEPKLQAVVKEETPPEATKKLSPAVHRLVEEHHLEPETIQGSGKDGRITKKDVLELIESRELEKKQEEVPVEKPAVAEAVEVEDKPELIVQPIAGRQTRVKMTSIRKRTAERLVQSQQSSAHLTTFNEINMSKVMDIRTQYRDGFEQKYQIKLGFMSFFVKASCSALAQFPEVNAQIEGDEIIYNNFYNIGIAVSTERGLLVPVIKYADKLSFGKIEQTIRSFAEKARNKKLSLDELTGGTFTITNGGVFGSLLSTPIPNPPQTAILGMHAIQKRPIALNNEVIIQPMMYVALTYDHRLIDGREAVSFLVKVKESIEDPQRLLLEI